MKTIRFTAWAIALVCLLVHPTWGAYNPGRMLCAGGGATTFVGGSTGFLGYGFGSTTEAQVQFPLGMRGTAIGLFVNVQTAPGGVQTNIYTANLDGSPQTMTCTITGAATTCSDLSHTFSFNAGQIFDLGVVTSATAATSRHHFCLIFTNP